MCIFVGHEKGPSIQYSVAILGTWEMFLEHVLPAIVTYIVANLVSHFAFILGINHVVKMKVDWNFPPSKAQ